jgi:predicted acetyltransferase
MIIRLLTRDDVPEHDRITSQAFAYSCEIGNPDSSLPCEKVLGAFDDDNKTLFADLEINEKKCRYDGGILTCAAVGGVAAKPEHRGKGAVKALFANIFDNEDYDISILYPFSEEYYRKLGYERVGRCISADIPFSEIADIGRNTDVTLYEGKNTDELLSVYNKCAQNFNLCFVRDGAEAYPDNPYRSQKYTYLWKNGAYATFQIDREKSILSVSEIYFDSRESMLGILGFLRNFESNQKTLCFEKLPVNTPIFNAIRDLRNCDIRIHNTGSAVILKMEKVLKLHKYPAHGSFTIQAGADIFAVNISDGAVEVKKDYSLMPDVITDIGTASKIILCGADNADYNPDITINNPETVFFEMFPPKNTFFSDCF